ncbi:MAG: addiction module protein [Pseudomonadota bacterium]
MNARLDHLIDEALALAPDERSVALALLDSLDGEDEGAVSKAWADEIRQRKRDLRSGVERSVPWIEARARLAAR